MIELWQPCLQLPLATGTQFNLGWSSAFLADVSLMSRLQVTSTAYLNFSPLAGLAYLTSIFRRSC